MVRYFHLEEGGGRLHEITEGEYEFRLRKYATWKNPHRVDLVGMMRPGFGFESPFGTCFAVEMPDGKA